MPSDHASHKTCRILAPMNGTAVALDQVPDQVFSRGILGDGVAICPDSGRILAPVDGVVSAVTDPIYAFGFFTQDGLEILMHVGMETRMLGGEGFHSYVSVGDRIKAGDPVAEIDLALLESRNITAITPLVICEGGENLVFHKLLGRVTAGETAVMEYEESGLE